MLIELVNIKPNYMSDSEISGSDLYMKASIKFEKKKKYLIKANSGHGKTSLLNFIYGSNTNFNGIIKYNGLSNSNNDVFDYRISNISYVFQDFKLFQDISVFENLQLKNNLSNHKTVNEIHTLIEQVSLEHKKDSLVKNLSLGQKQRVAILRALCQPFEFLLLDEPFSHLDQENIQIITNLIKQEVQSQKASLIMTTLVETNLFDFDKILNL